MAGRNFGTDDNFVAENKIVTEVTKNKKWVGKNQKDARKTLEELMLNKGTADTIRKGIAEFFINRGEQYFKEQGGKANRSKPSKEEKKKAGIVDLTYNGKTGTEDK